MIVENLGYLTLESVSKLDHFLIYETHKKTHIVIKGRKLGYYPQNIQLFFPKKDRLPWKDVEGKKICTAVKVFDSTTDSVSDIDTTKWNNGNQIMSYQEFSIN